MTIAELRVIVNHCEKNPEERVYVKVKMPDGGIMAAEIKSFGTYADGLVLNVEI